MVGVIKARALKTDARCTKDTVCRSVTVRTANLGMLGHRMLDLKGLVADSAVIIVTGHSQSSRRSKARVLAALMRANFFLSVRTNFSTTVLYPDFAAFSTLGYKELTFV